MEPLPGVSKIAKARFHSINHLSDEFAPFSTIEFSENKCTIGRSLDNIVVLPCLSISRLHCTIDQVNEPNSQWRITGHSKFGIFINGNKIESMQSHALEHNDIVQLDLAGEFVYRFMLSGAQKRKIAETVNEVDERIQKAIKMFDNTQNIEIDNMKNKIKIAKVNLHNTLNEKDNLKKNLEQQLFINLEKDYQNKSEDQTGRHDEVEEQNEEQKQTVKEKILEEKIKDQLAHKDLLEAENRTLMERLTKEKEEFEKRLNSVMNLKEQKLDDLENRLKKKEAELIQERGRMEELRLLEMEQQKRVKEEEVRKLKEIQALKIQLEKQQNMTNEIRMQIENEYHRKIDEHKKEVDEFRLLMLQQNDLRIAEQSEQEIVFVATVTEKNALEQQLAQMERDKMQLQELLLQKTKQSEEEILQLQKEQSDKEKAVREQCEKEKERLFNLLSKETESCNSTVKQMHKLTQAKCRTDEACSSGNNVTIDLTNSIECNVPSTSYPVDHVNELNRIMDADLQCPICSEIFIQPIMLNCGHVFCKYCIEKWKKKKKECPVCRAKIKTQLRPNFLESLINSMVDSLGHAAKEARIEIVRARQESVSNELTSQVTRIPPHQAGVSRSLALQNEAMIRTLGLPLNDFNIGLFTGRRNRRPRARNNRR